MIRVNLLPPEYRKVEETDASAIAEGACVRISGDGTADDGITAKVREDTEVLAALAHLAERIPDLAQYRPVEIVADHGIERGGCVLEVGACSVDAQITPALARVREVLKG